MYADMNGCICSLSDLFTHNIVVHGVVFREYDNLFLLFLFIFIAFFSFFFLCLKLLIVNLLFFLLFLFEVKENRGRSTFWPNATATIFKPIICMLILRNLWSAISRIVSFLIAFKTLCITTLIPIFNRVKTLFELIEVIACAKLGYTDQLLRLLLLD